MMFAELAMRFIMGGSLITLISLLAKTKNPTLAGIFVLFPAVTLVGYWFIAQSVDAAKLQSIAIFSIYAMPTTLVFLIAFYFACSRFAITWSLLIAIVAWLCSAGILIMIAKTGA